jgi:hydroxymethylglutaryl-CoA synthase
MLGVTACLDIARPGDRILQVSYGSGAGSDALYFIVTDKIAERRSEALFTMDYINRRTEINYATYARYRGKIDMG